jgi:hypothetical protein
MRTAKLQAPMNGKNENWSASTQPSYTSPDMNNVRPRSVLDNRAIIGQRPGLKKAYQQCIGGADNRPVVAINQVTIVEL